jgi:hypothetical protein
VPHVVGLGTVHARCDAVAVGGGMLTVGLGEQVAPDAEKAGLDRVQPPVVGMVTD